MCTWVDPSELSHQVGRKVKFLAYEAFHRGSQDTDCPRKPIHEWLASIPTNADGGGDDDDRYRVPNVCEVLYKNLIILV